MKKSHKQLILVIIAAMVFGGIIGAQERDRRGELRGVFVKLAERRVGDQGYMGIVVRPFERDDHLVVLVPREHEELAHSARMMREGDRLEIYYVSEHGQMWIDRFEVERRRVERERSPEEARELEIRRERIRRDRESMEERREGERRIIIRRESEPGPEARREERPHREPPPHEILEHLLREVIARHMEQMGIELREILGHHIGRMHEELMELRTHTEHMRREIEELRHENEMLRMKLHERGEPRREGDRERRDPDRPRGDRERRDPDRPRGERDRPPREVQRDREHDERGEAEHREQREQEVRKDRERDEVIEPASAC